MERIWKFSKPILLASASPRRRELLTEYGAQFDVIVPTVDESLIVESNPKTLVLKEAMLKLDAALAQFDCTDKTVICADTIVYRHRKYGKPSDLQNAVSMLKELTGRWHSVFTGVAVCSNGKTVAFAVRTFVKLKEMSASAIEEYVYAMKPLDKAGAYAIQENTMVEKYFGSYTNVVGLPMERLGKKLQSLGVINEN